MTDPLQELFWFIRPNDTIAVFSDDPKLSASMRTSRNTGEFILNSCPEKKVDMLLFDKSILLDSNEAFSMVKNHLLPDGKVILHTTFAELRRMLINKDFLQEAVFGDYEVLTADFVKNYNKNFEHKEFEKYFKNLDTNLCSFSRDYHNPYMYRNIVQMGGSRLRNEKLLKEFCKKIITDYPEDSPDKGAAFCVLGYRYYLDEVQDSKFFEALNKYCENNINSQNPHVIRWIISLNYLLAIYHQNILKDSSQAIKYFKNSYEQDFRKFSGLICTKQVAACGNTGYIYLSEYKDAETAKQWFKNGIERAKDAINNDFNNMVGKEGCYIPFGFSEVGELCDIASQCVFAYNNTDLYFRNPELFNTLFNRVRFGLVTRCQKLEKEIDKLRNDLVKN